MIEGLRKVSGAFAAAILVLGSAACVQNDGQNRPGSIGKSPRSGFVDGGPNTIINPKNAVVLIFNHGTVRPQYRHNCRPRRDVPGVVRSVAANSSWRIFYLCSLAIDTARRYSCGS